MRLGTLAFPRPFWRIDHPPLWSVVSMILSKFPASRLRDPKHVERTSWSVGPQLLDSQTSQPGKSSAGFIQRSHSMDNDSKQQCGGPRESMETTLVSAGKWNLGETARPVLEPSDGGEISVVNLLRQSQHVVRAPELHAFARTHADGRIPALSTELCHHHVDRACSKGPCLVHVLSLRLEGGMDAVKRGPVGFVQAKLLLHQLVAIFVFISARSV